MASGGFNSAGNTFFQAPFATGARNGLSIDAAGNVVLGNDVGAAGQPAQLLNIREILTNAFFIRLISGLLATDPETQLHGGFIQIESNLGNESSLLTPGQLGLSDGAVGASIIMDQGIALATEMRYIANLFTIGAQGQPMLQLYLLNGNLVISQTVADNGEKLQVEGHVSMFSAIANLDFPLTNPFTSADLTIVLPGAVVGDMVVIGYDPAGLDADSTYTGFVDSPGSVTVRFNNYSVGAIDPGARDFTVSVLKPF